MKKNVLLLLLMISININILSSSGQNNTNTDSAKKLLEKIVKNEYYNKLNQCIENKEAIIEKTKKHSRDLFNRGTENYDIAVPAFVLGMLSTSTHLRVLARRGLFFGATVACISSAAAFGGYYALKVALENEKTTEKKA